MHVSVCSGRLVIYRTSWCRRAQKVVVEKVNPDSNESAKADELYKHVAVQSIIISSQSSVFVWVIVIGLIEHHKLDQSVDRSQRLIFSSGLQWSALGKNNILHNLFE